MDIIICILFGSATGWLISKKAFHPFWDIMFGSLGALAGGLLLTDFGYNPYSFLLILIGAVTIVHLSRTLHVL
jgi:uncharacterized membrane protein YeaQ/YmgE (transglycosylase-associated protein family)